MPLFTTAKSSTGLVPRLVGIAVAAFLLVGLLITVPSTGAGARLGTRRTMATPASEVISCWGAGAGAVPARRKDPDEALVVFGQAFNNELDLSLVKIQELWEVWSAALRW